MRAGGLGVGLDSSTGSRGGARVGMGEGWGCREGCHGPEGGFDKD